MALSEGDKAIVASVAAEMIAEIVPKMLDAHQQGCPVGRRLVFIAGVAVGVMACLGGGFLFKMFGV